MNWTHNRQYYEELARNLNPAIILVEKDKHWLFKAAWWVLAIVSFGIYAKFTPYKVYMENYNTALGPLHGYHSSKPTIQISSLRHEAKHTNQSEFFGWFVPILGWFCGRKVRTWIGMPLMFVFYFVLPFPLFFAYGRYRMELAAQKETCRVLKELNHSKNTAILAAQDFAKKVAGPTYGWSWPKKWCAKGFEKMVEELYETQV